MKLHFFSLQKTRYSLYNCLSLPFVILLLLLSATPANAYDVVIAWDPNGEQDLAGYVLYVDDGISEILYEYVDTYPLEDIDLQNPSVKITDLRDDLAYYFVVTAYDADGTESDFSDEICVINGEVCPESWLASRSNLSSADSASGGSGGGGGGCFISTSNYIENNKRVLSSKHIFLFLMYLTVIGIIGLINKRIISA
jgi:hypothetical protein